MTRIVPVSIAAPLTAAMAASALVAALALAAPAHAARAHAVPAHPVPAHPVPARAYVRVNQVGFAPGEPRRALLLSEDARPQARFSVRRRGGGVALRGRVGRDLGGWSRRFRHVYPIDLSRLTAPGAYAVTVGGAVGSPTFRVAEGSQLYGRLLGNAIAYYRSVRDGPDVIPGALQRRPAHLRDSSAPVYRRPRYNSDGELLGRLHAAGGTADLSGGWFDAGDYLKFAHTSAYVDAVLLLAARDSAARFPAGFEPAAEARFGADWLLRAWDDGSATLYHQVGIGDGNGRTILGDHDFWRLPEADDRLRVRPGAPNVFVALRPALRAAAPGAPVSPNLAGRLAAAFGLCAQVFRASDPAYADRCLLAGEHIFGAARTKHVGRLLTAEPYAYYPESEWRDDLELGATELARALQAAPAPATAPHADPGFYLGEAARWAAAYLRRPGAGGGPLDVYDVSALGHAELADALSAPGAPAGLPVSRGSLITALERALTLGRRRAHAEPFGLAFAPGQFDTAPHALGYAVMADRYERLSGSRAFRVFGQRELDWVLGANAWGASFVVGAGRNFPRCMQSQIANLSGSLNGRPPLQLGATVGGPNSPDQFADLGLPDGGRRCPRDGRDRYRRFSGHGARYLDDVRSWPSVEPAIDYTALTLLAFSARAAHAAP
jgi:endoglucanase